MFEQTRANKDPWAETALKRPTCVAKDSKACARYFDAIFEKGHCA